MESDAIRELRRAPEIETDHAVSGRRIGEPLDEAPPEGRPETGDADDAGPGHGLRPAVAPAAAMMSIR
jgi:hypothetical protein